MISVRTVCFVLGCLAILAGYIPAVQAEDDGFVTLLSAPGRLEIVRHPPADDYTEMRGRGKITSLPSYHADSEEIWQIDLRSCDLSGFDVRDRLSDLMQATFDSRTVWPAQLPPGFDIGRIMELGKNPGLGLRAVHRRGITGKGVGLAIIEPQPLLVDHREYKNQLRLYEEIHSYKGSHAHMHGTAVASIAVGKTVGVAPEADLYFIAEWHARSTGSEAEPEIELTPLAQAIDRLIAINKTLPPEHRIRVISISLGINPRMAGFDLAKQAIARAREEGVYTVYVESDPFMGLGREPLADPDRSDSYGFGQLWARSWQKKSISGTMSLFGYLLMTRLCLPVPMDSRCTAAPTGDSDYVFYRTGAMSWTVPWIAGLYALACQVKPDITPKAFWETARKTSVAARAKVDGTDVEFGQIINPEALLDALKRR